MGVGKSKIIADAINSFVDKHGVPEAHWPIVILVNSEFLRDDELPKELEKWGCKHKVKIACYQTAYRWKNKEIGLLICDELDYALSDSGGYAKVFEKNKFDFFLGMTGSLIPSKFEKSLSVFSVPPFMRYTLKNAQEDGVVNRVKMWIHEVPLTTEVYEGTPYGEISKYKWITKNILQAKHEISKLYAIKNELYHRGEDYSHIEQSIFKEKNKKKYWEFSPANPNSRMSMMRNTKSLNDYAKKLKENLLQSNKDAKVIVFAQLTKIVDEITKHQYHGKKADKSIIDRFNEGDVSELGVVKKVHRGINFQGLNNAVVHSYTSSMTDALQAYVGRLVRLPIEELGHIHFLVSYYHNGDEKMYCQNAYWLGEIVGNVDLNHIEKQIVNLKLI